MGFWERGLPKPHEIFKFDRNSPPLRRKTRENHKKLQFLTKTKYPYLGSSSGSPKSDPWGRTVLEFSPMKCSVALAMAPPEMRKSEDAGASHEGHEKSDVFRRPAAISHEETQKKHPETQTSSPGFSKRRGRALSKKDTRWGHVAKKRRRFSIFRATQKTTPESP